MLTGKELFTESNYTVIFDNGEVVIKQKELCAENQFIADEIMLIGENGLFDETDGKYELKIESEVDYEVKTKLYELFEECSPIVLVRKKTGDLCLCVDYRELNKKTLKDNFPLPRIEDQIDKLRDKYYFTKLDLKNVFHHVKLNKESIKLTSFITHSGQYEYLRMLFGLKNSPPVFMRYINLIFKDLIESGEIPIFIDDIMIATKDIQSHFYILQKVLKLYLDNLLVSIYLFLFIYYNQHQTAFTKLYNQEKKT
ncbi:hypothetical protein QTP88_020717 [Uroleucon formosanum]